MFRNRGLAAVGSGALAGLAVWVSCAGRAPAAPPAIDLVQLLPQAERRSTPLPPGEAIVAVRVSIDGQSLPCILERPQGRVTFRLTPAPASWFRAMLAVDPSAWDRGGDGVLFRLGVSGSGLEYVELLNQHVHPGASKWDRRWIPVALDLSAWAGREINLILSTNASRPGAEADFRHDDALWGAPVVVVDR